MNKNTDTSKLFVGGSGMFIQYHDIIKPVYFYAIMNMIISGESFGVPVDIISNFSLPSMIEWYKNRRYVNPIQQLDVFHKTDQEVLDNLLSKILDHDASLYKLAPELSTTQIFSVYSAQHFSFPVYIYSEEYESGIEKDVAENLKGIESEYLYGDLEEALTQCDQNFTYIFSNIETLYSAVQILDGTYSHILLARDYRYNYTDNFITMKYNLKELMKQHPPLRLGTITAMDISTMNGSFNNIFQSDNASSDDEVLELDEEDGYDEDSDEEEDDYDDGEDEEV